MTMTSPSPPLAAAEPGLPAPRPHLAGVRTGVRWGVEHGVARVLLSRAARRGDPQARLVLDRGVRGDPYPLQDQVRAAGPLVRGAVSWVSASHPVCREVLRSDDFGSVGTGTAFFPPAVARLAAWSRDLRATGPVEPPSLLAVEGATHARYRALVAKVFTARAVEGLRPQVQAITDRLVDDLLRAPGGRVDLVERWATLLPVAVIAAILGVPESEHATVLRLGDGVARSIDLGVGYREYRQVHRGLLEFNAWVEQHLERLRREPGDDLLSQLVTVEDEGRRLTPLELRSTAGLLLGAGFETTVNLLGSGARLLLDCPDQLALLQAEPGRWPDAVEEVLRVESPVQVTGRVALRDTEVGGRAVRAGSVVTTLLGAANRDPDVFPDPHRFDVTRTNAREHLAFSGGRHFCLGAALARVEGEVGLRTLFDRLPALALEPGARRRDTRVLRGWAQLPARVGTHAGPAGGDGQAPARSSPAR